MRIIKSIVAALFILSTNACCVSRKIEKVEQINNIINTATFNGTLQTKPGEFAIAVVYNIKIDFFNNKAVVNFEDKTYTLDSYPTGSGYGYSKDGMDLRGKGNSAILKMADGRVLDLIEESSK